MHAQPSFPESLHRASLENSGFYLSEPSAINADSAQRAYLERRQPVEQPKNLPSNKKRMEAYEQILIEGDLESVINIWNILFEKKNQNGLNQLERDVYQKVEEMLVSEIMIASNLTLDRAKDWLRMYAINS